MTGADRRFCSKIWKGFGIDRNLRLRQKTERVTHLLRMREEENKNWFLKIPNKLQRDEIRSSQIGEPKLLARSNLKTSRISLANSMVFPLQSAPESTLAIVLGAKEVIAYLRNPLGYGLPKNNLLCRFNSKRGTDALYQSISDFAKRVVERLKIGRARHC